MRRLRFMLAALVLLAISAWLMHGKDAVKAEERGKDVRMPRYPTPDEYKRRVSRRTLMDRAHQDAPEQAPVEAKKDPLHQVLPYDEHKGTVIIEASAIRFSPLGERVLACLDIDAKAAIDRMREETGIDILDNIDRIGFSDGALVVTGNFEGLTADNLERKKYGDHGTLLGKDGEHERSAIWNDQLLMIDVGEERAKEMIDRLEGRIETETPTFPEHLVYGEIYGWVPVQAIAGILPDDGDRQLGERLREAADKIELHVSVGEDVGVVARVTGNNENIRDLGKSIGGAMALARTFAVSREEKDLAEILELGRVVPYGNAFDVELALPSEALLRQLGGECGTPPAPERAPE
jgi:hypothetical protein